MATVNNVTDTGAAAAAATGRTNDQMGKNEFLQLLVTQLRYQNPLEPMEDKEFIAQMAQFSSLEQMQNINATMLTSLEQMQYMNGTLLTSQASGMIGKHIDWVDLENQEQSGVVTAVHFVEGVLTLKIGEKTAYLPQVVKIKEAAGGE